MSVSQVHIAGIGIASSSRHELENGAVAAGTKALLDSGITYAKVQLSVACSLDDANLRIRQTCFKAFGRQKAPVCSADSHCALYMASQCIKSGQSDCAMLIGLDAGTSNRSGSSAQIAAIAIILISDRFLISHAFLKESAVRVEAYSLKAPGFESREYVEAALRQAGFKAEDIQMIEMQGSAQSSEKEKLLPGNGNDGTATALAPLKDLGTTGLAGLCGIVWRLRGWVPGQNTRLHHCLQHTSTPNGQAATLILSRSDGQAAAAYADVQHLRDGRERLGYNPAKETRDIDWRMEGVKSREGDRMPVSEAGRLQLSGNRAALARL